MAILKSWQVSPEALFSTILYKIETNWNKKAWSTSGVCNGRNNNDLNQMNSWSVKCCIIEHCLMAHSNDFRGKKEWIILACSCLKKCKIFVTVDHKDKKQLIISYPLK